MRLGAQRHGLGLGRQRDAPSPATIRTGPIATISSASPTNR